MMKKKVFKSINVPEVKDAIESLPSEEKIFLDRSMEIASYIVELMHQHGILQKELASRMSKTEAEVSRMLSGMQNYTLRSLAKVEAALGCQVIYVPKTVTTPPMIYQRKITSDCLDCKESSEERNEIKGSEEMSYADAA